jgi:tRNA(fMet)-specific endonuclease VapC
MTRYLLDTGIAADYIHQRNQVFAHAKTLIARGDVVGIGIPVLIELVHGMERSTSRERNRLRLMRILPALRLWPVDEQVAFQCGLLLAEQSKRGITLQFSDAMIAAIALTLPSCVLVTKDSDFAVIPGLIVEDWSA